MLVDRLDTKTKISSVRPGLSRELDRQAKVPTVISHAFFLTRSDGTDKNKNPSPGYMFLSIKTHLMG